MSITKVNERYKCIQKMQNRAYTVGKIYLCEVSGCLTNDRDDKMHSWYNLNEFKEYFIEYKETLQIGDTFICKEDVIMSDGEIAYQACMIYNCEEKNCLTDDQQCSHHSWKIDAVFHRHFTKNKKTSKDELKPEFISETDFIATNGIRLENKDLKININVELFTDKLQNRILAYKMYQLALNEFKLKNNNEN